MVQLPSSTGINPVQFTFNVDDFRVHKIPGLHKAKIGSCFVRASVLVKHLDLDKWLAVNPRVPNRNQKGLMSGYVVRGIRETLQNAPKEFALKNQGLYLLVDSIGDYDRNTQGGKLKIRLSNPEYHGLCNGGHTYAAIREYAGNDLDKIPSCLDEAWVRLHLFEGIDPDKVPPMAEGLNRSKQVDDPSLLNLDGKFEAIKKALAGKDGADQVSYHQGDDGAYYVTDLIRAIMFFNCDRFDDRHHPSALYRQQKKMIDSFKEDIKKEPSPIDLIIPKLHEIMMLMDKIAKVTPSTAKNLKPSFDFGRMASGKDRTGSKKNHNTPLYFSGEEMNHKVPNGWLMVMLAAFRANVDWNLPDGTFKWKEPLEELLPNVISDLVRICVQEYRDNNAKPDEMARNASIYEQCHDKVRLALIEYNRKI